MGIEAGKDTGGGAGTGRGDNSDGRKSELGPGKREVTGESEAGRRGWVEEVAISESWLSPSAILVFLETGAGAGLSAGEAGWVGGSKAVGAGSAARERMADWRWKTTVELVPGEATAWARTSRTLDQLAGPSCSRGGGTEPRQRKAWRTGWRVQIGWRVRRGPWG